MFCRQSQPPIWSCSIHSHAVHTSQRPSLLSGRSFATFSQFGAQSHHLIPVDHRENSIDRDPQLLMAVMNTSQNGVGCRCSCGWWQPAAPDLQHHSLPPDQHPLCQPPHLAIHTKVGARGQAQLAHRPGHLFYHPFACQMSDSNLHGECDGLLYRRH